MLAKNFAEAPASAIAENSATNSPRGNETGARRNSRFCVMKKSEGKHVSPNGAAFGTHSPEFRIACQPPRLCKTKPFRHDAECKTV